ncbi:MAG: YgiT-type zinc finger protein [Anaerolineae bacterium]|nr:YgiT-type zinc finger protein [Anaerolineae bacterium]
MQNQKDVTDFWEGETCEYCGGTIVAKRVTRHRKIKGSYILLENVPAGVCTECGTHYFSANVLQRIEETVRGRKPAQREEIISIYAF